MGILKYMVIWKLEWVASKELLRCLGWSIINLMMMNPSPVEVPNGHCVQMNILIWNCRSSECRFLEKSA